MRSRNTTKRDSSPAAKVHGSSKKWTRRFGKNSRRPSSSSQEQLMDENDGDSDFQQREEGTAVQSNGPLQSQPDLDTIHQAAEEINPPTLQRTEGNNMSYAPSPLQPESEHDATKNDSQNQGIEYDLADCVLNPSSSSTYAVMAVSDSSSTGVNSVTSPSSNPPQTPSSSTQSTWSNQRPRLGSGAQVTHRDKIDDDAYGAWWFLASISESFDSTGGRRTPERQQLEMHRMNTTKNDNSQKSSQTTPTRALLKQSAVDGKAQSVCDTDMADKMEISNNNNSVYEAPSPRHVPHQSQQQNQQKKQPAGGEYTLKEQRIRKESLQLSGTINYDQWAREDHSNESFSSSPYYYIPPQHASIPPNNSSKSDLDMTLVRSTRSGDIQWTPQDSSYGAALPAFGWVPKRVRKLFEVVFVVFIMGLLIFVVVKTGIKLKSSGSGEGGDIYFEDDDHYIAFNDDENGHSQGSESNDGSDSNDGDSDQRLRYR